MGECRRSRVAAQNRLSTRPRCPSGAGVRAGQFWNPLSPIPRAPLSCRETEATLSRDRRHPFWPWVASSPVTDSVASFGWE